MSDTPNWQTRCEYHLSDGSQCGERSHYAYRAMGGGWCLLCEQHGAKHHRYAITRTGGFGEWVDPDGSPRLPQRKEAP